jgi:hypothetical protein
LKKPDVVECDDVNTFRSKVSLLADKMGKSIYETADGGFYLTNDNGASILFFDFDNKIISTALTRQELIRTILISGDLDLFNFFKDLMNLPNATTEDFQESKKLKDKIDSDNSTISKLLNLPTLVMTEQPDLKGKKTVEVPQGAGLGSFVTSDDAEFIGTNGMAPCVALVVHQDKKAIVIHVDSFSGAASLGGQGAAPFLDRYIGSEFIQNDNLKIYLIGANQGGRQNVLDIYEYLEENNLEENIVAANVLGKGESGSVVVDVNTGEVYPGAKI